MNILQPLAGPTTPVNEPVQSISNINIKVKNKESFGQGYEIANGSFKKGSTFSELQQIRQNQKGQRRVSKKDSFNKKSNGSLMLDKQSPDSSSLKFGENYSSYHNQLNQPYLNASYAFNQSLSNENQSKESNKNLNKQLRTPAFETHKESELGAATNQRRSSEHTPSSYQKYHKALIHRDHFPVLRLSQEKLNNYNEIGLMLPQHSVNEDITCSNGVISPLVSHRYDENNKSQHLRLSARGLIPESQQQNIQVQMSHDQMISQGFQLAHNSQRVIQLQIDKANCQLASNRFESSQQNSNRENEVIIRVQDNNWLFEITQKEIDLFRLLKKKLRERELINKNQLAGTLKSSMKAKTLANVNRNIRPKSSGKITQQLKIKDREMEQEKQLMQEFFEMMKARGKGIYVGSRINKKGEIEKVIESSRKQEEDSQHIKIADTCKEEEIKLATGEAVQGQTTNEETSNVLQNTGHTYTVFKKLSRQYRQNNTFQKTQSSNSGPIINSIGSRRQSRQSFDQQQNQLVNQENVDITNIMHINSLQSLRSQLPQEMSRPFSAAANTNLQSVFRYTGNFGRETDHQNYQNNQNQSVFESTRYNMRPLLLSSQTAKKDASIQNDRDGYSSMEEPTSHRSPKPLSKKSSPHTKREQQSKNFIQKRSLSTTPQSEKKPLWIVSTSKRYKYSFNQIANHKGNLYVDYEKSVLESEQRKKNRSLINISQQNNSALGFIQMTKSGEFEKSQSNPIKIQIYNIDLESDKDSKTKFRPRFSNQQIKKYFQHKKYQSQEQINMSSASNSPGKTYNYKSINMSSQGNHQNSQNIYDTPMFAKDQADLILIENVLNNSQNKADIKVTLEMNLESQENFAKNFQPLEIKDFDNQVLIALQNKTKNPKKNILISKKSPIPGFINTSALQSSDSTISNERKNQEMVNIQESQDVTLDPAVNGAEIILLEHIKEETGESFDSDHANSCHTMPSNFIHDSPSYRYNFPNNQNPTQLEKMSKSFHGNLRLLSEPDEQENLKSLTDRSQSAGLQYKRNYKNNSSRQIQRNQRDLMIQKSSSLNESKQGSTRIQLLHNLEREPVAQRNNSSQQRNRKYQQAMMEFTSGKNIETPDEVTRNQNIMHGKSSSKTPTTRVISKIGGQVNPNLSGTGENFEKPHERVSPHESQSSLNDQQNPILDLQGENENEGFLEIPRYQVSKDGSKQQTHVEVNGLKVLHDKVSNYNEDTFMNNRKDSSFDMRVLSPFGAGIATTSSNEMNFYKHQVSFDSKAKNHVMTTGEFSINKKNNRDLINYAQDQIRAQSVHKKNKDRIQGNINMLNMMEITPATRTGNVTPGLEEQQPNQDESKNKTSRAYVESSYTHYLEHQREYKLNQDKKNSQMLRRNMNVFRKQQTKRQMNHSVDLNTKGLDVITQPPQTTSNIMNITSSQLYSSAQNFNKRPISTEQRGKVINPKSDAQVSPINFAKMNFQASNINKPKSDEQNNLDNNSQNKVNTLQKQSTGNYTPSISQGESQVNGLLLKEYFNKRIDSKGTHHRYKSTPKQQQLPNLPSNSNNKSTDISYKPQTQISYSDILNSSELNEVQRLIIKNRNVSKGFNQFIPQIVTDQSVLLSQQNWANKNLLLNTSTNTKPQFGSQINGLLSSGSSTQMIISSQSTGRRQGAHIFQRNRLMTKKNNAQSNMALERSQKKRYQFINKKSESEISHTTNSQSHYFRNNSALSNGSLQLNGSHIKGASRPQSKLSNRELQFNIMNQSPAKQAN